MYTRPNGTPNRLVRARSRVSATGVDAFDDPAERADVPDEIGVPAVDVEHLADLGHLVRAHPGQDEAGTGADVAGPDRGRIEAFATPQLGVVPVALGVSSQPDHLPAQAEPRLRHPRSLRWCRRSPPPPPPGSSPRQSGTGPPKGSRAPRTARPRRRGARSPWGGGPWGSPGTAGCGYCARSAGPPGARGRGPPPSRHRPPPRAGSRAPRGYSSGRCPSP